MSGRHRPAHAARHHADAKGGCARYIGRVGALALALGIGSAVTGSGFALADPGDGHKDRTRPSNSSERSDKGQRQIGRKQQARTPNASAAGDNAGGGTQGAGGAPTTGGGQDDQGVTGSGAGGTDDTAPRTRRGGNSRLTGRGRTPFPRLPQPRNGDAAVGGGAETRSFP